MGEPHPLSSSTTPATCCTSTAGQHTLYTLTMSTELRTKQPKNIIGHDNSSVVNWIHVAVIAPGLAALAYRPQYVKYMPWVGGAVAVIHGYLAMVKGKPEKMKNIP